MGFPCQDAEAWEDDVNLCFYGTRRGDEEGKTEVPFLCANCHAVVPLADTLCSIRTLPSAYRQQLECEIITFCLLTALLYLNTVNSAGF